MRYESSVLVNRIMAEAREAMKDYGEVDEDEFTSDYASIVLREEAEDHHLTVLNDAKEFFGIL